MSDARLRELERAAATGDPRARVALLVERVRLGELDPERIRLAAYLDSADARRALTDLDLEPVDPPGPLKKWLQGFLPWGKEVAVRAALAAAAFASAEAEPVERREAWPDHLLPAQLLEAGLAWLRCPCAEHRSEAEALVERPALGQWAAVESARRALRAVAAAPHPLTPAGKAAEYVATKATRRAVDAAQYAAHSLPSSQEALGRHGGTTSYRVRLAIEAALVPWALQRPG